MSAGYDISRLRLADETWDAVCIRVADLHGPRPIGGWGLLVMESTTRQIQALEHLDSAEPGTVADAIIAAFLAPENGEPRQPLELRVADHDLAHALQQKLHAGPTTIEVAPLPAAVDRLTEALTAISEAADEVLLFPEISAPAYFRAAATLYKAKPWAILDPDHKLRLHFMATGDVWFAAFVDDEAGPLGLSIFPSEDDFDRAFPLIEDDEDERAMNNSLSILYVPESEVAEAWSQQRRHARWVIAGPEAFPLPAIVRDDGSFRPATDVDLGILAQAASAITGFVARNRKRLARAEACSSRIDVTGDIGKTAVEVSYTPTVNEVVRALEEVIARVIVLPQAKPIMQRLRWTFYRAPGPLYAQTEDDAAEAVARFLSWCVFASEKFALPLVQEIRAVARDIQVDGADLETMLTPRISYFDVVEKQPTRLIVRDRRSNDLLVLRRDSVDPGALPGAMISGALHDTGRGDYVLSLGAMTVPKKQAGSAPALKEEDLRVLAPAMEGFFGARADWIDEIPKKEVRDLYEQLRHDLQATGDRIPNLPALQKIIADAESATKVVRDLMDAANPWGEGETQVIGALFKRIWNFTPRPELGGRSPEQMP